MLCMNLALGHGWPKTCRLSRSSRPVTLLGAPTAPAVSLLVASPSSPPPHRTFPSPCMSRKCVSSKRWYLSSSW